VDDIVAIKVTDSRRRKHYFLTWGRVFHRIDPEPLITAIKPHLRTYGIEKVRRVDVCNSLQEASRERYFFEALFHMSAQGVPFGKTYTKWKSIQKKRIQQGKEIHYLGRRVTTNV